MTNLNLTQEKLAELRSEYKHRNVRGKYPRQKMLPEYRCLYPWVIPDETDPYYTFCTVCECRLSAKRSDLGKHEGSIKHTENATKKGLAHSVGIADRSDLVLKGIDTQQHICVESSDSAAEITVSDDDDDDDDDDDEGREEDCMDEGMYIKQEPVVDLIETSSNALNFENLNAYNRESQDQCLQRTTDDVAEDEADDIDEDDDDESDDESFTPPPAKRSTSESNCQLLHSSQTKITTRDTDVTQRFSISKVSTPAAGAMLMQSTPMLTTAQAPCKITIKKISVPIATALQSTTQATITPVALVPTDINISKQQNLSMPIISSSQMAPPPLVRDSFDLFFDSICATVKTLPPKLATEGKVRVMQLIGELEIRAITDRESSQLKATSQQNSTVASTTK